MTDQTPVTATKSGTIDLGDDLTVHRLGFGAMRVTGPGIWGEPPDREEARALLRRVVELGVDFIDTADSYGPEVSEELIAEALSPYPDELVIATKGGLERPGRNRWTPNGRPGHLVQACEGSLRRLRLEQIPLYQYHRPDPRVPLEDSIGALVALKEQGKIRHIGLSNVDADQLRRAQALTPIVSIQNRYNLTDRSSESIVDLCGEGADRVPAVGADPGPRRRHRCARDRRSPRRQRPSGHARLVARPLTDDARHPWHRFGVPPRSERRCRRSRVERRRGRGPQRRPRLTCPPPAERRSRTAAIASTAVPYDRAT